MRRSRRRYGSYRGRRTANDVLKATAVVLGILVVLVLGGLVWGQKYIVFTDNGLKLDGPFHLGQEKPPEDIGDISVEVQQPGSLQEEPENPVQPEQPEVKHGVQAMELSVDAILDGSAAQKLEAAGANGVIVEMKTQEGQLNWVSEQPLAVQAGVNSKRAGVNEALRAWNEGQVYTIARVCCFRDNTLPYQNNSVALRASYGNWRDERKLRWLNPDNAQVQEYLVGLCRELAQLGFDEVLLECCTFPTQGKLGAIVKSGSFASGEYTQAVTGFLTQVRAAVEESNAVVGVHTERAALAETAGLGGLNGAVLESCAHRVWMKADEETPSLTELLTAAGIQKAESRLVSIVNEFPAEAGADCAILN